MRARKCVELCGVIVLCALMSGLAACSSHRGPPDLEDMPEPTLPAAQTAAPRIAPAALATPRLDTLLVAGSNDRNVYDDAVLALFGRLEAAGTPIEHLHAYSADKKRSAADTFEPPALPRDADPDQNSDRPHPARRRQSRLLPGGTGPATRAVVLRGLIALNGTAPNACLAFFASNVTDDGLQLRDDTITPAELDRALSAGCGNAPTVVIVSACNAGSFAASPMTRSNRLILTAAATGRNGFGCGPNVGFTTFDECLLGSLDRSPTWARIFERTKTCVARREKLVGQPSVGPQSFIGPQVAALPAPWADEGARTIDFRQGVGRFAIEGTPFFSVLRGRAMETLEDYGHAPTPKAMALTYAGTVVFATPLASETADDVARIALQRCEWQSGGSCVLYARDDGLSAAGPSGQPPVHQPLLVRAGPLAAETTPFIRDDQRRLIEAYLHMADPKALALGPDSEAIGIGHGASAEAARAAALKACATPAAACVVYAEDNRIVLGDDPSLIQ